MRAAFETALRTVDSALRARAAADPDAFVKCAGDWLTAAEINSTSDRIAAGLHQLDVQRGDRVGILASNRQEYIELIFAVAKLGAVIVPLNPFLRGDFLAHQLTDSTVKVVVADAPGHREIRSLAPIDSLRHVVLLDADDAVTEGDVPWAQLTSADATAAPRVETKPTDLMSIMYTSGTTGPAKGCMLSHGYYANFAAPWAEREWITPGDRIFSAMPLFHTGGHMVLMFGLMLDGTSVCFEEGFSASTYMHRAAEENATCLFGIGVHGAAVLQQPEKPSDGAHPFRIACFPPMQPDDQDRFEQRFATPVIAEGIGQTEMTPGLLDSVTGPRKRGANGRPCYHVDVDLLDEEGESVGVGEIGELVIRPKIANAFFSGYWNRPDATAETWRGVWHHTGDSFTRDGDGFYTFVDRKSDSLRRRGENISSFQLEAAIAKHHQVKQVAVCAVPSDLSDIEIKACIVPREGERLDPEEMFQFFKDNLPYFAVPRYVDLRESLPMTNATNRVQKGVLRAEGLARFTWDLQAMGYAINRDERRR